MVSSVLLSRNNAHGCKSREGGGPFSRRQTIHALSVITLSEVFQNGRAVCRTQFERLHCAIGLELARQKTDIVDSIAGCRGPRDEGEPRIFMHGQPGPSLARGHGIRAVPESTRGHLLQKPFELLGCLVVFVVFFVVFLFFVVWFVFVLLFRVLGVLV